MLIDYCISYSKCKGILSKYSVNTDNNMSNSESSSNNESHENSENDVSKGFQTFYIIVDIVGT